MSFKLVEFENGQCILTDPIKMPRASGYLWNKKMMLHANARGFITSQFMQPEPMKYSHAPILEGKIFMLPEEPYYAHHPGRFFYIKDGSDLFSLPHEPVRKKPDSFKFIQNKASIEWEIIKNEITYSLKLILPKDDVIELWELKVKNNSNQTKNIEIYPYFTIGYMSWMNQSAEYNKGLNAIIGTCVAPYQKLEDYFKNQHFKDKTYFISQNKPIAFETRQMVFEGEGGLNNPSMLETGLQNGRALYETPAAIFEFKTTLKPNEEYSDLFIFGPALDDKEIAEMKERFLAKSAFEAAEKEIIEYIEEGEGVLKINTPNKHFNESVNIWMPRQVYYHGDTNRLTTDPQTRNYLQDAMGSVFINPETAKTSLFTALSQQKENGSLPDGIKLYDEAELKYINQIPHTDHPVWILVLLEAYLAETNDYAILEENITDKIGRDIKVKVRINAAMDWLIQDSDYRGLNYIAQGDWNDPMNMVGYKGKGVSGWLTLATSYVLKLWGEISESEKYIKASETFKTNANKHLWDKDWYARGITDDDVKFGIATDIEGKIYLNPQSFAFLAGAADEEKTQKMLAAIEAHLETPYGAQLLAPAYTKMRDDVGRLTQKWAGAAENGAVYNHATAFYIYSLFTINENNRGFSALSRMIAGPNDEDYLKRGQLPLFIPNYYRGAYKEFPETAGRSSQLFNTGTIAWVYRTIIEQLFGLKGTKTGLSIAPKFPEEWDNISVIRKFRGAVFEIEYRKSETKGIIADGLLVSGNIVSGFEKGKTYKIICEF